jgi:5-methylcytosine-specific restriction endonuclease McrA
MRNCVKCGFLFDCIRCPACAKERSRKRRIEYPEKVKEAIRKYKKKHSERIREARKVAYIKNREKYILRSIEWRIANREKSREAANKRRAKNREKQQIENNTRRARKRAMPGKISLGARDRLFKFQRGKCPCCGLPLGNDCHIDHIIPIYLGGANDDLNIQLLRKSCNLQKSNKHPVDFMQSRGFLL